MNFGCVEFEMLIEYVGLLVDNEEKKEFVEFVYYCSFII